MDHSVRSGSYFIMRPRLQALAQTPQVYSRVATDCHDALQAEGAVPISDRVVFMADNQLHNLYTNGIKGRTTSSGRYVPTAIRPVQLDLFGEHLVEYVINRADEEFIIHLGDACDPNRSNGGKVYAAKAEGWVSDGHVKRELVQAIKSKDVYTKTNLLIRLRLWDHRRPVADKKKQEHYRLYQAVMASRYDKMRAKKPGTDNWFMTFPKSSVLKN
jgi:hypothetical protein